MTTLIHSTFGTGTFISNDSKTVKVDFGGNVKTLVIKYANLLNEDGSVWSTLKLKKESRKAISSVSDDATFKGQIWYESYKEDDRNDMQLLIDAKKEYRKEGE